MEFPGALRADGKVGAADPGQLFEVCSRLNAATRAPWVILSEGWTERLDTSAPTPETDWFTRY
ncbi:hypothetical protein [Geochorda subterranea]|uniref:Uncharacterized protein n=1 Tax=Geochorda subterranea TaxID=3109564 RepID=A0ABZ1BLR6_9FIRM|nr:hypothetical protein [Limnochorda sp. LNt]WRP13764.1 hypothetical protein VLY81_09980 [Limnochorda sp. LNt]